MKQGLNICRVHLKGLGINSEDVELSLVPHPIPVDPVPIPGPHLAGGDRQAAALLAFEQSSVGFLKLRGAGANAIFQLGIEPLQLPGLAIQLGENLDLGAQHLRNDRYRNVVDCAHLVTAQPVNVADLDGGNKYHSRLLEARMLADHASKFETVQFRHADIDQNNRNLVLEEIFESLAAGGGHHEILAELLENDFIGEK